jgi:hypothetical protein
MAEFFSVVIIGASASQKVRVWLSFERVYDDHLDKDWSHSRAKRRGPIGEGRASAIIRCRRHHAEPILIGYARFSTVDQNLALQCRRTDRRANRKHARRMMETAQLDRESI